MFCASLRLFSRRMSRLTLLLVCTLAFVALAPVTSHAQRGKADERRDTGLDDRRAMHVGGGPDDEDRNVCRKQRAKATKLARDLTVA